MNPPLLYRAARKGVFGKRHEFACGSITDALFVFLDGSPEPESAAMLDRRFRARPLVCLTDAWEKHLRAHYPDAAVYRRYMMKPAGRFSLPEEIPVPEGYRIVLTDEAVFRQHPFSHGNNFPSYAAFRAEGSGAAAYRDGEIVASASSFLSLDGETELDVSTKEEHRGNGLAGACIARMLQDCMERGIVVHWDAQNEISRRLALKFGFEQETDYPVFLLPEKEQDILKLRPYQAGDAKAIVSWTGDETAFRKWCADRYESYPITAEDMNRHYGAFANPDCFYPMTAYDSTGPAGHLIMRFTDEQKTVLRFGFVIVDDRKRGKGCGKAMLQLAVRYAFETLKAKKITLGVFENNETAYRCYLAAGFRDVTGTEPAVYHFGNEAWKCLEMEMTAQEGAADEPQA